MLSPHLAPERGKEKEKRREERGKKEEGGSKGEGGRVKEEGKHNTVTQLNRAHKVIPVHFHVAGFIFYPTYQAILVFL